MATQHTEYQIAQLFGVSDSTIFNVIERLISCLFESRSTFIRWPEGQRAASVVAEFRAKRGIDGVMGAIDGSHIAVLCPRDQPADYVNRKGFHSIVLQAVCDADMSFTDVYVGWPGSVHDARVFRNSPLFAAMSGNPSTVFPNNSFLLGDAAYPLSPQLMTPFKDTGKLTRHQSNYNFCQSSTRIAIERAFGLLKGRFRRLKLLNVTCPNKRIKVIVVACVLHNVCLLSDSELSDDHVQELNELIADGGDEEVNGFEAIERADSDGKAKRLQIVDYLSTK